MPKSTWESLKQVSNQNRQNWGKVKDVVDRNRAAQQAAAPAPTFSTSPGGRENTPLFWDDKGQTFSAQGGRPLYYDARNKGFTTYKTPFRATLGDMPADPSAEIRFFGDTPPEDFSPGLAYGGLSRAAMGNLDVAGAVRTLTSDAQKQYVAGQIEEAQHAAERMAVSPAATRTIVTPSRTPGGSPTTRTVPILDQDLMTESDNRRIEVHGYKNEMETITPVNTFDRVVDAVGLIFGGKAKGFLGKALHDNPGLYAIGAFPYAMFTSLGSAWANLYRGDIDKVERALRQSGDLSEAQIQQILGNRRRVIDAETGRILDERDQQLYMSQGKGFITGIDVVDAKKRAADYMWSNVADILAGTHEEFEGRPDVVRGAEEGKVADLRGGRGGLSPDILEHNEQVMSSWKESKRFEARALHQQADQAAARGDANAATELLIRAHEAALDGSDALYDPSWAFTWMGEPDRKRAFARALAEAEVQRGRGLNDIEVRQIRDRFVNNTTEFIGETAVDITNYAFFMAPVGRILSSADDILLRGGVKAGARAIAAPFKRASAVTRDFFRLEGPDFAKRFPEFMQRTDALSRTLNFIKEAQRPAVISMGNRIHNTFYDVGIRLARSVQTVGDLKVTLENFGKSLLDPKISLPHTVGPQDQARIRAMIQSIFSPNVGKGIADPNLKIIDPSNWGNLVDDVVQELRLDEIAGKIGIGASSNPDIVMRRVSQKLKSAFIASHGVKNLNVLDDTMAAYIMRAIKWGAGEKRRSLADIDNIAKFVGAILKGGEFFKGVWAEAVLAGRPAWTFINTIDSTARYLLFGGQLWDDVGWVHDPRGLAKIARMEGIPGAEQINMMSTVNDAGQTVAERLLMIGERQLADGKGGILSAFGELFSGSAKNIEVHFDGLLGRVERALRAGPALIDDYNSAMEFTLRTRLFHKQFRRAHTILDLAAKNAEFARLSELGASPELDAMMRRLWDFSGHNAEKFHVIASKLFGGGTGTSRNWASFFPSGDLIAKHFTGKNQVLRETILRPSFEHVSRRIDEFIGIKGKVTAEDLDTIFDEVRSMVDDLVKQHANDRVARGVTDDIARATYGDAGESYRNALRGADTPMPNAEEIENLRRVRDEAPAQKSMFAELDPEMFVSPSIARTRLARAGTKEDLVTLFRGAMEGSVEVVESTTIQKGLHAVVMDPNGRVVIQLSPKLLGGHRSMAAIRDELQSALFEVIEKKLGPMLPEGSLIPPEDIAKELKLYASRPITYQLTAPDKYKWIQENVSGFDLELSRSVQAVRGTKEEALDLFNPAMAKEEASYLAEEVDEVKQAVSELTSDAEPIPGLSPDYRGAGQDAATARFELNEEARALDTLVTEERKIAQAGRPEGAPEPPLSSKANTALVKRAYIYQTENTVTLLRDRMKRWVLEEVERPLQKQGEARKRAWNAFQEWGQRAYEWSSKMFGEVTNAVKFLPADRVPTSFDNAASDMLKRMGIDVKYGNAKTVDEWLLDPNAGVMVNGVFKNTPLQKEAFLRRLVDVDMPGNWEIARALDKTPYRDLRSAAMNGAPQKMAHARQASRATSKSPAAKAAANKIPLGPTVAEDLAAEAEATIERMSAWIPAKEDLIADGMTEAQAVAKIEKLELRAEIMSRVASDSLVMADVNTAKHYAESQGISVYTLWSKLNTKSKTKLIAAADGDATLAGEAFMSYIKPRKKAAGEAASGLKKAVDDVVKPAPKPRASAALKPEARAIPEGWRAVQPGEVFGPGREFRMGMGEGGQNLVKMTPEEVAAAKAVPAPKVERFRYSVGRNAAGGAAEPEEVELTLAKISIPTEQGNIKASTNIGGVAGTHRLGGAKWLGRSTQDSSYHLFEAPGAGRKGINDVERASKRFWVHEDDLPAGVADDIRETLSPNVAAAKPVAETAERAMVRKAFLEPPDVVELDRKTLKGGVTTHKFSNGHSVETWYDKKTKTYVTQIKDPEGNQVGEALMSGTLDESRADWKAAQNKVKTLAPPDGWKPSEAAGTVAEAAQAAPEAPKVLDEATQVNEATRAYLRDLTDTIDDFDDDLVPIKTVKPSEDAMKLNDDLTQVWDEAKQEWVDLNESQKLVVRTARSEALVRVRQAKELDLLRTKSLRELEAIDPTLADEWAATLDEMYNGIQRGSNGSRNFAQGQMELNAGVDDIVGQGDVSTYRMEGAEWWAQHRRGTDKNGTGLFDDDSKADALEQVNKAMTYILLGEEPKIRLAKAGSKRKYAPGSETRIKAWMDLIRDEAEKRMFPEPVWSVDYTQLGAKAWHEIIPPSPSQLKRWGMLDEDYLLTHPDAAAYIKAEGANLPDVSPTGEMPLITKPLDPAETAPDIVAAQAAHNAEVLEKPKLLLEARRQAWNDFIRDKPPGRANSLVDMFGTDAATPEGLRKRLSDTIDMLREQGLEADHPFVQAMNELQVHLDTWYTINKQIESTLGAVPVRMPARTMPVGYNLKEMPYGARQALFGDQTDATNILSVYRFLDEWRGEAKAALASGMPGFSEISDADKTILAQWLDGAARAKQQAVEVAINGSGDQVLPELGRWKGAVNIVNNAMLDYTTYSKVDRIMKQIFPFWMFPSRSLGMWAKEIAQHPQIAGYYYRYYRWSLGELYNQGAVTSDGKPLARLRGYMRLPGTNMWINPLAPISASIILRSIFDLAENQDAADMEQMDDDSMRGAMTWLYKTGRLYGFSPAPWITFGLMQAGALDPEKTMQFSIIPQIELMPPNWSRYLAEKVNQIRGPGTVDPKKWARETPWQDSTIEVQLLGDALKRIQAASSDADREAIIKEVKDALENRENNDLWLATRGQVEKTQYWAKFAGFFTGFYAKPWTEAEAELKLQVRDLNLTREAINNEMKAQIFGYDPDPVVRFFDYSNLRYSSTPGQLAGLYNHLRYVKMPETGDPARGDERRAIAQKLIHDDEVSGAYYDSVALAYEEYNKALSKIPVGDTAGRKRQRDILFKQLAILDEAPMYGDAKKPWSIGYKPEELVYDKIQAQWWETLRRTQPYWDSENGETWDEYQMEMKQWLAELPQIAQDMVPYFMQATVTPYFDATEAGQGILRDLYGNTTRAMDLKKLTAQLLAESTPEGWDLYDKSHDTPHDALQKAWQELYWNQYWETVKGLSGYDRQLAELEFKKRWPNPPTPAQLSKWVMENYPDGKFTEAELLNAVRPDGGTPPVVSAEERLAPKTEVAALADETWDWLAWAGPSKTELTKAYVALGGDSGDIDTWYNTSGHWGELSDPRAAASFRAFHDLLGLAVQKLGIKEPDEMTLREMAEAKRLNEMLNSSVEETLGPDIWSVISQYGQTTSRAARNEIKSEHPELKVYWAMKDEFAAAYPMWAKYYVAESATATTSSGGGGGGGGSSRGGGGGGGSSAASADFFQPMGKRSTMNADELLKKLGKGGYTNRPTWPKGFAALIGETLSQEVAKHEDTGAPVSAAATTALKGIAARHPEYKDFIQYKVLAGRYGAPSTAEQIAAYTKK